MKIRTPLLISTLGVRSNNVFVKMSEAVDGGPESQELAEAAEILR